MKEFIKSLWNQEGVSWGNTVKVHQWWMIAVTLLVAAVGLLILVVNFSWFLAGVAGAAAWQYRDEIKNMILKESDV